MLKGEAQPITQVEFQKLMVLLAEKRTAHTTIRSGVSMCTFALAIVSFLIAMSASYSVRSNLLLLSIVGVGCFILFYFGYYFLHRGIVRIRFHDSKITEILNDNEELASIFYHKHKKIILPKNLK